MIDAGNKTPIYFSKIEFQKLCAGNIESIIHLNLIEGELSYQKFNRKFLPPMKIINSEKTNYKDKILQTEGYENNVEFSYGVKLKKQEIVSVCHYCNALDFEPYRNREMSMDDEGFIGYRDEVTMKFIGVTDSYIPYMEIPMNYLYDEAHMWPTEKLLRFLYNKYFSHSAAFKNVKYSIL